MLWADSVPRIRCEMWMENESDDETEARILASPAKLINSLVEMVRREKGSFYASECHGLLWMQVIIMRAATRLPAINRSFDSVIKGASQNEMRILHIHKERD